MSKNATGKKLIKHGFDYGGIKQGVIFEGVTYQFRTPSFGPVSSSCSATRRMSSPSTTRGVSREQKNCANGIMTVSSHSGCRVHRSRIAKSPPPIC